MDFLLANPVLIISILILAVIAYGTFAKTRWGINFSPVNCPNCGEPAPRVRRPGSGSQAMWGGSTCAKCGTGMDKWGRQVSPPTAPPAS